MPYLSMAARVSPPPAMEKPSLSAMARESASVPWPNWSISNTPTGPFQRMVPASLSRPPRRPAVSGPMSRIISSSPTWSTGLTTAEACSENSVATTTSVGSGISTLAISALA